MREDAESGVWTLTRKVDAMGIDKHSELQAWHRRLIVFLASLAMLASQTVGVALGAPGDPTLDVLFRAIHPTTGDDMPELTSTSGVACLGTVRFRVSLTNITGGNTARVTLTFDETNGPGSTIGFRELVSVTPGTVVSNDLGTPFTTNAPLVFDVPVTGLTSQDVDVVVRVGCTLPFSFSGTVQAQVGSVYLDGNKQSAGAMTVPMKSGGFDLGKVRISKTTVDPTAETFPFTETLGTSTQTFTLASGAHEDFTNLFPGTYVYTEDAKSRWELTGITCTGGGTTVDLANRRVSVVVGQGSDVACTFANDVVRAPALDLHKSAWNGATEITSGGNIGLDTPFTYRLSVGNHGNAAYTPTVVVTDIIPDGLTIGTLPAGCLAAGQTVTCQSETDIPANANAHPLTFDIPVRTPASPTSCGTITNRAWLGTDTSGTANATHSLTLTGCAPVLTLVKDAVDAGGAVITEIGLGGTFRWKLTVTNTGNAASGAVQVTDNVPVGLTIGDLTGSGCNASGQAVTCTTSSIASGGASHTWYVPVQAPSSPASCPTYVNTAQLTGGNSDDASVRLTGCVPGLTITKDAIASGSDAAITTIGLGQAYRYRITVTNTGNAPSGTVQVTDAIPASLTLGTLPAGCSATGHDVTCTGDPLAPSASHTWLIPVTAPSSVDVCADIDNTAMITGGASDGATVTLTGCNPAVDIDKDVFDPSVVPPNSPWADADTPGEAVSYSLGDRVVYRLTVKNVGNVPLSNLDLTDTWKHLSVTPVDLALFDDEASARAGTGDRCDEPLTLAPGATFECFAAATVDQVGLTENEGKIQAVHPNAPKDDQGRTRVTNEDLAWINVAAVQDVSVDKRVQVLPIGSEKPAADTGAWLPADSPATGPTATIGVHEVWIQGTVTNTGNVPLTILHLLDDAVDADGEVLASDTGLFDACIPDPAEQEAPVVPPILAPGEHLSCVVGPLPANVAGLHGDVLSVAVPDEREQLIELAGFRTASAVLTPLAHGVVGFQVLPLVAPTVGTAPFVFFAVAPGGGGGGGGPTPASLTIQKRTVPGGAVGSFTFTPAAPLTGGSFVLGDGQSKTFTGLAAGSYSVTESALPNSGWSLTSIDCGTATASRVGNRIDVTLAAGQSATCVFTNTFTEVAGVVIEQPSNPNLSVVKDAQIEPDADGTKSVVFEPGNGATITYVYTITNTGDVTITDITAVDDILGDLFPAATTLAPGESTTATATHVVTEADSAAQRVVNVVVVNGTSTDGDPVTATDTETVEVIEVLPTVIERPPAPAPEPAPETLPRTGADAAGLFALALLLLAIGLSAMGLDTADRGWPWGADRRRRRRHT